MIMIVISFALVKFYAFAILYVLIVMQIKLVIVVESHVFLARNRMLTRVVAKQAKTTKVKNKFVNGNKKFKKYYSVVFLVEGEKFNLGEKN